MYTKLLEKHTFTVFAAGKRCSAKSTFEINLLQLIVLTKLISEINLRQMLLFSVLCTKDMKKYCFKFSLVCQHNNSKTIKHINTKIGGTNAHCLKRN